MQHTKGTTFVDIKLRFALMLIVLTMALSGCSQKANQDDGAVSKDTLSAPLPDTLTALAVDTATLVVEIIVDGGTPQACTNLSVDQENSTYSCDITLSTGPHTLSLVYSIRDNTNGTTLQVTTTSGINVDIIAGQTSSVDFSSAILSYDDNDGDGINNLDELTEGSNPAELSYYIGGTINGLLGSGSTIQLNVGGSISTLDLVSDGNFIIKPAVADNSTYTVTVLTQPNAPSQICTVTNGSDTVSSVEVTNVAIQCVNDNLPGSAPTASDVRITDDNGGNAVVGDGLTGNYSYNDVDGDAEGTSTFRWLRNGVAITGAVASTYTLVAADVPTQITFEVTPVAVTGTTTGVAVTSSGIPVIDTPVVNNAPTASDVSITDDNGGNAVVGDRLTGNYSYNDVDGDIEGTSTFRWLRNGVVITGVVASTYTLVAADVPTQITFEVTPVATTGNITGNAITSTVLATGTAPVVVGFARYLDINMNGVNDANDQLIIPFDQNVSANAVDISHFNLPVTGDTFGTGATVAAGPASNEVTITLGSLPNFKTRQDFSNAVTVVNSASGIDVATLIVAGAIESASGIDAVPSIPIDLIPAYVDSLQSLGANESTAVALGDLDGDGDLDMVVANGFGDVANRVYTNDGNGNYTDSGQALGANNTTSVALGDVNGDGNLDIVTANELGRGSRVYTNNGAGRFSDSGQALGTDDSQFVALGDVDGDGDLDMVVANRSSQPDRVYTNDGTGSFFDSGQLIGTNDGASIALGDIDSDGDLDMVVANDSGRPNQVYTNDGIGNFADSGQLLGTNSSEFVTLGDVDGDGDLDMVVANLINQGNRVYTNNGAGSFTDSGQSLGTSFSTFIGLSDVDSDGDLDMVVTNSTQANRIYTNNGTGNFTDSGQLLGTNTSQFVALGDVDGDGDLDMVVANSTQANQVYLNSLTGTWGKTNLSNANQLSDKDESKSVALGDIDGDGDLDMVVANNLGEVAFNRVAYTNDGTGRFAGSQSFSASVSTSVALGDLDGDGDLDMVVANLINQGNQVYINNGAGSFTDSGQSLGLGTSSTSVALGDVDGDGDLDMVVANSRQANRIYTNDGTGSFTDSSQLLGTNSSTSVALGDMDGDGDLDIVVANNLAQANRIYINDSKGSFTDSGQLLGTNDSTSVALGDVDGDGDLDMVVANAGFGGTANRIYTNDNDGTGNFTDSGQLLGSNVSSSIALGDIDGDGDPDMVVTNSPGNVANRFYINDGAGNFSDSGQLLGSNVSSSVTLGDVDGDGDLDIVVAVITQANQVYLNQ